MATKFTPMTLIGSIMSLAAFGSLVIGINSYFMTKAEADEIIGKVTRQQQVDQTENALELIELEKRFLEEDLEENPNNEKAQRRLKYLEERQHILAQYQLELTKE